MTIKGKNSSLICLVRMVPGKCPKGYVLEKISKFKYMIKVQLLPMYHICICNLFQCGFSL